MARVLLQRLLLLVPSVWFVLSLVFLLSRSLPGTYADRLAEADQSAIGAGSRAIESRRQWRAQQEKSGLNQPLFYFTWKTRATPDTLDQVYPQSHQAGLKQLIARYGNWPAISAYYLSLSRLRETLADAPVPAGRKDPALQLLNGLFQKADPTGITQDLTQMQAWLEAGPVPPALGTASRETESRYREMVTGARPGNTLVPALKWNGTENQYHQWLTRLVRGDLGLSLRDQRPVGRILREATGNTGLLLAVALLFTFLLGVELALMLVRGAGQRWRDVVLAVLFALDSIPLFIVALLLLVLLAGTGYLDLFPLFGLGIELAGGVSWWKGMGVRLSHLALPAFCLVLSGLPYVATQLFRAMEQMAAAPYITTARAKGLPEKVVRRRHLLRNALLPLITLFTGYLPAVISGAVVIEVIFAIPGTGRLLAESVLTRDYPVVLGLVLFVAFVRAGANLLADFLYFTADPRTRPKNI